MLSCHATLLSHHQGMLGGRALSASTYTSWMGRVTYHSRPLLLASGHVRASLAVVLLPLVLTQSLSTVSTCSSSTLLYTSGSATYVFSSFTSSPSAPTCPVAVTLTTTGSCSASKAAPQVTITSYVAPPVRNYITDGTFENGNLAASNAISSGDSVTGEVISGGPLAPFSGSQY